MLFVKETSSFYFRFTFNEIDRFRFSIACGAGARREREENARETSDSRERELSSFFSRVTDFARARQSDLLAPYLIGPVTQARFSIPNVSKTYFQ